MGLHLSRSTHRRWLLPALVIGVVVATGVWLRSLPASGVGPVAAWWTGSARETQTVYFYDGPLLVPVSRRLDARSDAPRAALEALLSGPPADTGLHTAIPLDVDVRSLTVSNGTATVDLTSAFLGASDAGAANAVVVQTLATVPGVRDVEILVEGRPHLSRTRRTPLAYYASLRGLAAEPLGAASPREAVDRYLQGPVSADLVGLPRDVTLLGIDVDAGEGLVSLRLRYTPAVRTLAIERPDTMRTVLLGLVATLTELPGVRWVRLDFEGHSQLGLGQCSDLLRTRQGRPRLLNDERLLRH